MNNLYFAAGYTKVSESKSLVYLDTAPHKDVVYRGEDTSVRVMNGADAVVKSGSVVTVDNFGRVNGFDIGENYYVATET